MSADLGPCQNLPLGSCIKVAVGGRGCGRRIVINKWRIAIRATTAFQNNIEISRSFGARMAGGGGRALGVIRPPNGGRCIDGSFP